MPVRRPHDKLFRTVFANPAETAALLRAHLPSSLAAALQWSSLTLQNASFVDDRMRGSEADLLFAESVRDWPWVPRFAHLLIDQSRVRPEAVRGELQGRIAQLMMMAPFRRRREALRRAAGLLAELLPRGGRDAVGTFVLYLLATQDRDTARGFGEELRGAVSGPGGDLMTYAEELIKEGERKGRRAGQREGRRRGRHEGRREGRREGEQHGLLRGQVGTIENLLRAGVQWSVIETATGIDRDTLHDLKQRLAGPDNSGTKETDDD